MFKSVKHSGLITISATIIITILSQFFLVPNLPDKYFYDSNAVLSIANKDANNIYDNSYLFAGNFFDVFNVFGLDTLEQWSCILSVIGLIILALYLKKYKNLELYKIILILATVVFLNIYVFRIGKDFIQWIFWLLVYLTLFIKKPKAQIPAITLLFIIESLCFRSYYIGIYLAFIGINYILTRRTRSHKKINYFKLFLLILVGVFVGLVLIQQLSPDLYSKITNIRTETNAYRLESTDASTLFSDLFDSNNVFLYMLNFVLNFLRIIFPIELIAKGVIYLPFIIFQICLSLMVLREIKNLNQNNKFLTTTFSLFLAYLMISSIFEPDFGSLIRHEVTVMPIYLAIILNSNTRRQIDETL